MKIQIHHVIATPFIVVITMSCFCEEAGAMSPFAKIVSTREERELAIHGSFAEKYVTSDAPMGSNYFIAWTRRRRVREESNGGAWGGIWQSFRLSSRNSQWRRDELHRYSERHEERRWRWIGRIHVCWHPAVRRFGITDLVGGCI